MDGRAFDDMSRAMAMGMPRRQLLARLGAGGLGAGLLAAIGVERTRSALPAAQDDTCRLTLVANVRLGPSAGAVLAGTTPGELRGELSFALGDGGAIDRGRLRLADGDELPVVGQAIGRAVHLRVQLTQRQPVVLVGTAAEDLGACRGAVDGLLTGPQAGDLGDWHATATALRRQSGGSSGTGGGPAPTEERPPLFATRTPTAAATGTAPPDATAPGTAPPGETATAGACPAGQTDCDGACVDLMTDRDHCGLCGASCTQAQICCGGGCVGHLTDAANCGACGTACAAGEACLNGLCQEPPPTLCRQQGEACGSDGDCCVGWCNTQGQAGVCDCHADGEECVPTGTGGCCNGSCNADGYCGPPCGLAGAPCGSNADCCEGEGLCCFDGTRLTTVCTLVDACPGEGPAPAGCPAGQTDCGGACVDLNADAAHCGACFNSCPLGGVCGGGVCQGADPAGGCLALGSPCTYSNDVCCSGACLNGICQCSPAGDVCADGSTCCSGACTAEGFCA